MRLPLTRIIAAPSSVLRGAKSPFLTGAVQAASLPVGEHLEPFPYLHLPLAVLFALPADSWDKAFRTAGTKPEASSG